MRKALPVLLAVLSVGLAAAPSRCDDDDDNPAPAETNDNTPAETGGDPALGSNPAGALGDRANFVNGIMFVGWSPQDHANGGAGTPKYDAYNYLVRNRVNPNEKGWPDAAVAALNKKYPCKFWAYDGETLWYEDEDIHTAPPGHGAPGGAIPGAKGEFIWRGHDGYVPKGNPCGGPSGQVNPPTEGGVAYKTGDAMELKEAIILNNPPKLADWPVTTIITALDMRPTGIHVVVAMPGRGGKSYRFTK